MPELEPLLFPPAADDTAADAHIKQRAELLWASIVQAYDGIVNKGDPARCRALAKTKLEEVLMWAKRGLR